MRSTRHEKAITDLSKAMAATDQVDMVAMAVPTDTTAALMVEDLLVAMAADNIQAVETMGAMAAMTEDQTTIVATVDTTVATNEEMIATEEVHTMSPMVREAIAATMVATMMDMVVVATKMITMEDDMAVKVNMGTNMALMAATLIRANMAVVEATEPAIMAALTSMDRVMETLWAAIQACIRLLHHITRAPSKSATASTAATTTRTAWARMATRTRPTTDRVFLTCRTSHTMAMARRGTMMCSARASSWASTLSQMAAPMR